MWTLVFIIIQTSGEVKAAPVGTYETMYECFENREQLSVAAGGRDGYFPVGMQGVCINVEGVLHRG